MSNDVEKLQALKERLARARSLSTGNSGTVAITAPLASAHAPAPAAAAVTSSSSDGDAAVLSQIDSAGDLPPPPPDSDSEVEEESAAGVLMVTMPPPPLVQESRDDADEAEERQKELENGVEEGDGRYRVQEGQLEMESEDMKDHEARSNEGEKGGDGAETTPVEEGGEGRDEQERTELESVEGKVEEKGDWVGKSRQIDELDDRENDVVEEGKGGKERHHDEEPDGGEDKVVGEEENAVEGMGREEEAGSPEEGKKDKQNGMPVDGTMHDVASPTLLSPLSFPSPPREMIEAAARERQRSASLELENEQQKVEAEIAQLEQSLSSSPGRKPLQCSKTCVGDEVEKRSKRRSKSRSRAEGELRRKGVKKLGQRPLTLPNALDPLSVPETGSGSYIRSDSDPMDGIENTRVALLKGTRCRSASDLGGRKKKRGRDSPRREKKRKGKKEVGDEQAPRLESPKRIEEVVAGQPDAASSDTPRTRRRKDRSAKKTPEEKEKARLRAEKARQSLISSKESKSRAHASLPNLKKAVIKRSSQGGETMELEYGTGDALGRKKMVIDMDFDF